jgi:hypothetical protein
MPQSMPGGLNVTMLSTMSMLRPANAAMFDSISSPQFQSKLVLKRQPSFTLAQIALVLRDLSVQVTDARPQSFTPRKLTGVLSSRKAANLSASDGSSKLPREKQS